MRGGPATTRSAREIGEFSYRATSNTLTERGEWERAHVINWEGTAAGYGSVVATMRVSVSGPAAKGGRVRWTAHAYLEGGGEAMGDGDGSWVSCGNHQWCVRVINHVTDGTVLRGDGVIDLATRSHKGKLYGGSRASAAEIGVSRAAVAETSGTLGVPLV